MNSQWHYTAFLSGMLGNMQETLKAGTSLCSMICQNNTNQEIKNLSRIAYPTQTNAAGIIHSPQYLYKSRFLKRCRIPCALRIWLSSTSSLPVFARASKSKYSILLNTVSSSLMNWRGSQILSVIFRTGSAACRISTTMQSMALAFLQSQRLLWRNCIRKHLIILFTNQENLLGRFGIEIQPDMLDPKVMSAESRQTARCCNCIVIYIYAGSRVLKLACGHIFAGACQSVYGIFAWHFDIHSTCSRSHCQWPAQSCLLCLRLWPDCFAAWSVCLKESKAVSIIKVQLRSASSEESRHHMLKAKALIRSAMTINNATQWGFGKTLTHILVGYLACKYNGYSPSVRIHRVSNSKVHLAERSKSIYVRCNSHATALGISPKVIELVDI